MIDDEWDRCKCGHLKIMHDEIQKFCVVIHCQCLMYEEEEKK